MAERVWDSLGVDTVTVAPLRGSRKRLWRGPRPGYPLEEVPVGVLLPVVVDWQSKGITAVISLLTDGEELYYYGKELHGYYRSSGLQAYRFPVRDHGPMRLEHAIKMTKTVTRLLTENPLARVLVHCSAGIGRTSMALGCICAYLGERGIMTVTDTGVPQTREQVSVVEQFRARPGGGR